MADDITRIMLSQISGTKLLTHFPLANEAELTADKLQHLSQGGLYQAQNIVVPCPMPQSLPSALSTASDKVEKALEDELTDCIPLLEKHGYKVEASNNETWLDKSQHSDKIFHDLTLLWEKLSAQMAANINNSSRITLVVPVTHIPFLQAKTGSEEPTLTMFKVILPQVELIAVPQLNDTNGSPCALLLCTSNALSPVGYMAVEGVFYVRPNNDSDNNSYTLHIPSHKLAIVNPTQMAVLTGI